MSKNVKVNGASYSGVPSVRLPLADGSGYAEFIDKDDTGGGGAKVEHGTATLSGTNLLTINHKLGKKPDFVFVWDSTTSNNSQKTHMIVYDSSVNANYGYYQYYRSGASMTKAVSTTKGSTSYIYLGTDVVTLPYYSSSYAFSGTYHYIIGTYS